jgi:hypothetical protein
VIQWQESLSRINRGENLFIFSSEESRANSQYGNNYASRDSLNCFCLCLESKTGCSVHSWNHNYVYDEYFRPCYVLRCAVSGLATIQLSTSVETHAIEIRLSLFSLTSSNAYVSFIFRVSFRFLLPTPWSVSWEGAASSER